jgi:hypothetical protein
MQSTDRAAEWRWRWCLRLAANLRLLHEALAINQNLDAIDQITSNLQVVAQ